MSKFSDYLEAALINVTLRGIAFAAPATVYLALYTSDPEDDDGGTEVAGGSYARQSVAFAAPADGVTSNSAQISFPVATADWGVITHVGIRDAAAAGNLLYHGQLDTPRTIEEDDQLVFDAGEIEVTLQ